MEQNIKDTFLRVMDEDTEMLDEQYSELNQMSDEAAYSYENVIRYKNKGKTASGIYTDSQSSAVCYKNL